MPNKKSNATPKKKKPLSLAHRRKISISVKKSYEDPERRRALSKKVTERFKDENEIKKHKIAMKKSWENPDKRAKQSKTISKMWEDPKKRKHQSDIMCDIWNETDIRERQKNSLDNYWTEERRKEESVRTKNRFKSKKLRKKLSRAVQESYANNPKHKENLSKSLKEHWKNPKARKIASQKSLDNILKNGGLGCNSHKKGKYKGMHFESSWELAAMIWYSHHGYSVKRCTIKESVTWKDKKKSSHVYLPDLIVAKRGVGTFIVEIKGHHFDKEAIESKNKAAKRKFGKKYLFVDKYNPLMKDMINYSKSVFGKNFWDRFVTKKAKNKKQKRN